MSVPRKTPMLYNLWSVAIATLLGGPIAAGFIMKLNYRAIGNEPAAKTALFTGVGITGSLIAILVLFPDLALGSIPLQFLPVIYTAVALATVKTTFGETLEKHKADGHAFQPLWKSLLVGVVAMLLLSLLLVKIAFMMPEDQNNEEYHRALTEFAENDEHTKVFYDHLSTHNIEDLLQELDENTIPSWERNINLMRQCETFESLDELSVNQNVILLKYAQLQLEIFQYWRKAIATDSDAYMPKIDSLRAAIDVERQKLNL